MPVGALLRPMSVPRPPTGTTTLLGLVGDVAGRSVIDIACGEGFYTRMIRRQGAARNLFGGVAALAAQNIGHKTLADLVELSDLLAGKEAGRTSSKQITVFANNTGMGLQFAAVGARVLALAEQQKLGREIPAEWLLQDTPP